MSPEKQIRPLKGFVIKSIRGVDVLVSFSCSPSQPLAVLILQMGLELLIVDFHSCFVFQITSYLNWIISPKPNVSSDRGNEALTRVAKA
jgi:hypothetical protein